MSGTQRAGVAFWAHVGGLLVGAVTALAFRRMFDADSHPDPQCAGVIDLAAIRATRHGWP